MPRTEKNLPNCIDCGEKTINRNALRCAKCNYALRKKHSDRREYHAEWARAKKYGLEPGEFDAFWIVFKGRCGICNVEMKRPTKGRGQALDVVAVDHCHKTGKVRGLLCNGCNKGLGLFKDNTDYLRNAIIWVTRSQES